MASEHVEDTAHASGDTGQFVLAVRNDADAALTSADGDYSPFAVDSAGRLKVVGTFWQATQPVSGTVELGAASLAALETIELGATTLAALETVTVEQGTSPWTVDGTIELGATTLAALETVELGATTLAALESITVEQGTSPWAVDGTVELGATTLAALETIELGATTLAALETVELGATTLAALESITATTGAEKAEDAAHASGAVGNFVLAVRNDADAALTSADGDYSPFAVDSGGRLKVLLGRVDVSGSLAGTGTLFSLDADGRSTLVFSIVSTSGSHQARLEGSNDNTNWSNIDSFQNSSLAFGTGQLSSASTIAVSSTRRFLVAPLPSKYVRLTVTSYGAGGTITAEGSLIGGSPYLVAHVPNTVATQILSATPGTGAANLGKAEDAAHASGDVGVFTLGVRNDADAALTSADGDYSPFAVDSAGRIKVVGTFWQATQPVSGTVELGAASLAALETIELGATTLAALETIELGATTLAALETVTVLQGTDPWVVSAANLDIRDLVFATDKVDASGSAVSITNFPASQAVTTDVAKVEDAAHASGAAGAFVLAVRNDADASLTSADGDYSPFAVDSAGRLKVVGTFWQATQPVSGTVELGATTLAALETIELGATTLSALEKTATYIENFSGSNKVEVDAAGRLYVRGTEAEDSAHTSGDVGNFVLAVRNDAHAALTSANGDYSPFAVDSAGRLGIRGSHTEDAAHVSGDAGVFTLAVRNDADATLTDADGDYSPFAVDSAGRLKVVGTTGAEKAEDAAHSSGATGNFVLAVRNSAASDLTSADGDYSPFAVDSAGRLKALFGSKHLSGLSFVQSIAATGTHTTSWVDVTETPVLHPSYEVNTAAAYTAELFVTDAADPNVTPPGANDIERVFTTTIAGTSLGGISEAGFSVPVAGWRWAKVKLTYVAGGTQTVKVTTRGSQTSDLAILPIKATVTSDFGAALVRSVLMGAKADGTLANVGINDDAALEVANTPNPFSHGPGRTHVSFFLDNQTADALAYTVTASKTLYVTSIVFGMVNTATGAAARLLIRDGTTTAGTGKLPLLAPPAGAGVLSSAVGNVTTPITFAEPLEFTTGVFLDLLAGTVTYSIGVVGYEE